MSLFPISRKTVTYRGRDFVVREMTIAEKDAWANATRTDRSVVLTHAVFHQTDWPADAKPDSVEALAQEPTTFIETLGEAIYEMSGITDAAPEGKAAS